MYDEIAKLKRSNTKKMILGKLNSPKTPSELARELNLYQSSVSRSLIELEKGKLVKCITPNQKNFRHYKITLKGKELLREL